MRSLISSAPLLGTSTTMRRTTARHAAGLLAATLLACALAPASAQTPARTPGAGFVNPAAPPVKQPPPDIAPIWKAPSIDMLATIRQRGQLRVCVVPVAPMVMRNTSGELVGFSIDLTRQLAQDLGVEPQYVPSTWADVMPDLLSRQCDLAATGLWVTLQRALVVNFTEPTATEGLYLVASKALAPGQTEVAGFDQPSIRIAVYPGTAQETVARQRFPKAQLLTNTDDPLLAVADGKAHAALVSSLAPKQLVAAAADRLYLPRDAAVDSQPTAIAIRKGDADFLHFLNTWLKLRQASGWLDQRAQAWAADSSWTK